MVRTRFFIDPSMTDQQIFDLIQGIKNGADIETRNIAVPEEKNDGSGSYDSKAEETSRILWPK